ncbi:MAG: hypothetical protein QNJ29_09100 [Rhizobiaceae bacterium]|nr:hypothetical protein [Rhizobiaceae bacterium]
MDSANKFLITKYMSHMLPIASEELKLWNTKQLLVRLRKLRALQDFHDHNDWDKEEVRVALILQEDGKAIFFKESEIWQNAFRDVKAVLATREHVPRGSKAKRQQVAWEKKHR